MKRVVALIVGLLVGAAVLAGPGSAAPDRGSPRDRIRGRVGVPTRVSFHPGTNRVRFLGTEAGDPIPRPEGVSEDAPGARIARAFLEDNGDLFGIADQARQLKVDAVQDAPGGRSVTRFQQLHDGVPVLGGELVVGLDDEGNILQANGETSAPGDVPVEPSVSAVTATAAARDLVAEDAGENRADLETTDPELWIYDRDLIGGPGPREPKLVWRMEVTSRNRYDIREFVLVDARDGSIVLHFSQIAHAKIRRVCDANNKDAKVPCKSPYARVEGQGPTGIADVDKAYDFGGGVYDFFKKRFNRDSIDNRGMPIVQTVKFCENNTCPYENAFWNGKQMVYGAGYASADDVVGHELVHGITDRTAGLFYWFQAGAINESLSDVFGELYDLTNGRGNDTSSVRWHMGEDLPSPGAIRNMQHPPQFGDPDRMTSSYYENGIDEFDKTVYDSGGVHINSGVNNKAAYLLTDGGSFNGRTIAKLGINKVAALYYDVVTNSLTSGSDYYDLYEAMYQSCLNLIGTSGFTASNCNAVREATLAVEMNQQPAPPNTFPNVEDAPMCSVGQIPTDLFYDNMEIPGKWQKSALLGTSKWVHASGYGTSGKLALYTPNQNVPTDTAMEMNSGVTIPSGTTTYLRFSTATNFEYLYDWYSGTFTLADGGVLEYRTSGGWVDAGGFTMTSPYWGTIASGWDNPLSGRQAFTDTTGGYFANRVNVSSLAGQSVRFRFRAGTDDGNHEESFFGWVVDDVRIYTCAAGSRPGPSAANLLQNPGFEWDDDDDSYPDYWSLNNSTLRMPGLGRNGSYAMRHKTHDPERYTSKQRVNGITPGSYAFKGYVKIPATRKPVAFTLQVVFRNGAGKALKTQTIKTYSDDTGGRWTRAARTMTAPTGTASADVAMAQKGLAATVLVDDFVFKQQ